MSKISSRSAIIAFVIYLLITYCLSADGQQASPVNQDRCHKLTRQARNYIKAGEPEKAMPLLEEALTFDPESMEAHSKLADALFLLTKFAPSIRACEYVMANDKTKTWTNTALYRRGCCYGGLKKYDLALKDLDEVIKREPTFGRAYYAKAEILRLKGGLKLAVACFHEALKHGEFAKSPDPIYLTCAQCERELSDFKAERAEYTALLKLTPSVDAHQLRGDSFMKDRLFREASDDYKAVLAIEPDNTHSKDALAVCEKQLGQTKYSTKK